MNMWIKAKAKHLRLGRRGEKVTRHLMRQKNIEVLTCNFRRKNGEIDIVALDGGTLCFIEVKTKRSTSKKRPAANLSERQKSRIYRAALTYMREIGKPKVAYRFDLVEVILSNWDVVKIHHLRNHFGQRDDIKYRKRSQ